jgi:hypothetical protein
VSGKALESGNWIDSGTLPHAKEIGASWDGHEQQCGSCAELALNHEESPERPARGLFENETAIIRNVSALHEWDG